MPRQTSKPTDPWAAIDALVKQESEPVGPEWLTVEQFAARYNINKRQAALKCCKMLKQGQLKRWQGFSQATHRIINKYSPA